MAREAPLALQGYGLSIDTRKGRVDLLRWDEGGVRDPGVEKRVPALRGLADVEACLWLSGPSFVAVIFDGRTKEELATLTWSDPSYADGAVGVYAHQSHDPAARLTLTVEAGPKTGGGPRPWLSDEWLAVIGRDELSRLDAAQRRRFRLLGADGPGQVALLTDEVGGVVLREAGLSPRRLQPGVPFRFRDPALLRRAAQADGPRPPRGLSDDVVAERRLRSLARRHPALARLVEVGAGAEGRPILGLRIASDPADAARPSVLLVAAHPASEAVPPELPLDAATWLLESGDPRASRWLSARGVVVVPVVNPDGLHAFWHESDQLGRKSRRAAGAARREAGVDLNRNYPFRWGAVADRFNSDVPASAFFRGPAPGSEPEVRAMMALARRERFLAAVSYHAAATKILVPYTIEGVTDPSPSAAWAVAEELVEKLDRLVRGKRYELVRRLYPVSGTEQDWYHHELGTLALLVEAPVSIPRSGEELEAVLAQARPAWQHLLERWVSGPSLAVRVVDAAGAPLAAEVSVAEIVHHAGERHSTRPDTGLHHLYLPAPGTYRVRATRDGRTAEAEVRAEAGRVTRVELAL